MHDPSPALTRDLLDILDDDPRPIPSSTISLDETLEMIQGLTPKDWPDFGLDRDVRHADGYDDEPLDLAPDWIARSGSTTASPRPTHLFRPVRDCGIDSRLRR